MRHRKKFNHLGRKSAHRKETLASMATALILHKRIHTTVAKAKALRVFVEPLITKSKDDSTHSRRTVFAYLRDKYAVGELFREVSQKVGDRPGGYTRILKTGFRKGDAAEMCFIELVDYNTNMLKAGDDGQEKRTRRSRRGKKVEGSKVEEPKVEGSKVEGSKVEEPKVEESKVEESKVEEAKVEKAGEIEDKTADTDEEASTKKN